MAAKIVELKNDARVSPLKCAEVLVEDLKSGKVNARRMVVVLEDVDASELSIRASGPGMDYAATTIGLLHIAATDLALTTLPGVGGGE